MKGDYIMAEELNVNVTGFNLPPIEVKGTFTFPPIRIEGQNGKSAYELWLEDGNSGTKDDFINSLKGKDGNPGLPGKDASTEGAYEMLLGLNVYCENSTPNEVLKGLIRGLGDVIKKQPKPFNFKRPSQGQTYISVSGTPYFRVALLGRGFAAGISLGESGVAQVPLDEPFNTKDVELEYFNMLGSIVGTYRVSGYASGEVTGPDFGAFVKDVPLTNSVGGVTVAGIGKETEKSNIFAKLALAHEFSGKMNTTYSAPGNPTVKTELDLKDTWLDAEIGGSWSVRPSTYLYGTFTKNFGATIDNTWRIDAGVRHNF